MFRKISGARAETLAGMALGARRLGATGRTWGIRPDWEHQSEHGAPGRIGGPGRVQGSRSHFAPPGGVGGTRTHAEGSLDAAGVHIILK
jgi:hypothetical protein